MVVNAKLHLKLDRADGVFSVEPDSTRIYERDAAVSLVVGGWTLEEITKTGGKTPYEPWFKLASPMGATLAAAKLEPPAVPAPDADGTYSMSGTLNTNTVQLVRFMRECGGVEMDLSGLVFATTEANPVAKGSVMVHPFFGVCGEEPQDLPSGAEELAALKADLETHKARRDNPHGVTPAQIGALTPLQGDARYAGAVAVQNLSDAVQAAQTAILGVQGAIAAANAAIQALSGVVSSKADASNTYRKGETYNKGEVDQFVANLRINPLMGKNFRFKTQNETRAALATVIQLFGGVVNGAWDVVHEQAAPMSRIPLSVPGEAGTVFLKAVKLDGELTSEVTR